MPIILALLVVFVIFLIGGWAAVGWAIAVVIAIAIAVVVYFVGLFTAKKRRNNRYRTRGKSAEQILEEAKWEWAEQDMLKRQEELKRQGLYKD